MDLSYPPPLFLCTHGACPWVSELLEGRGIWWGDACSWPAKGSKSLTTALSGRWKLEVRGEKRKTLEVFRDGKKEILGEENEMLPQGSPACPFPIFKAIYISAKIPLTKYQTVHTQKGSEGRGYSPWGHKELDMT